MSLLVANHKNIGRAYMLPSLYGSVVTNGTTVSSVVITPGTTPTANDLMVITIGGSQSRTITPPAGWYLVPRASGFGTSGIMYKVATGSEPANYTVNFSGTLSFGAAFFQLSNIDFEAADSTTIGATSVGTVTSLNSGNFNVTRPGIAISLLSKSATGGGWNTDNGFTSILVAGQHKYAWKQYPVLATGENTTWSGPVAETIGVDLTFFNSRYVK